MSDWAKSVGSKGATTLLADCRVTITKPEGTCTRFREAPKGKGDKERNGYDLDGQRFEAIGVSVPDPVSAFFNWSEVNVQRQQDPAFLLSKGAGEVASFLNRTVRLDAIDTHIQAANQLLRQEKDGLKLLQSKQADDQTALEALAWVPGVQAKLEALEALVQARIAVGDKLQRLQGIREQIEALEARIQVSERVVSMEPRVRDLRRTNDWRRGLMDQRRKLMEATEQWARWEEVSRVSRGIVVHAETVRMLREGIEQRESVEAQRRALVALRFRWTAADTLLKASSGVVAVEPRAKELRALVDARKALRLRTTLLRDLVERWQGIRVVECDWEALARKVKVLRARVSRVQGIREQVKGLQSFRSTITGLETTIQEAGKRVTELVAMRPAMCPLCGGPMHKGEHS